MKKEKHNGIISLWKFIFSCIIILFHGSSFYPNYDNFFVKGGYIAVEFFFIVSGIYLAKKALKKESKNIGKETIEYVWNFIKKLLPYLIIAYIGIFITKIIFESHKTYEWINSIWNLLLLKQAGFQGIMMNNQLWFLTSLIIGMFILYPLLKKYKENFIYLASPLIVVLGLGYLSQTYGARGLDQAYHNWDTLWYTGTIRAIIELNIGFVIYLINQKLKHIEYTKLGQVLLTIASNGLLILVVLMTQFLDNARNYDYIMLLFIGIGITIMISEKTLELKFLSNKFVFFLEKISMPMYINHMFIITLLINITLLESVSLPIKSLIALAVTIIFSVIETFIINKNYHKKIIDKTKKLIIKQ